MTESRMCRSCHHTGECLMERNLYQQSYHQQKRSIRASAVGRRKSVIVSTWPVPPIIVLVLVEGTLSRGCVDRGVRLLSSHSTCRARTSLSSSPPLSSRCPRCPFSSSSGYYLLSCSSEWYFGTKSVYLYPARLLWAFYSSFLWMLFNSQWDTQSNCIRRGSYRCHHTVHQNYKYENISPRFDRRYPCLGYTSGVFHCITHPPSQLQARPRACQHSRKCVFFVNSLSRCVKFRLVHTHSAPIMYSSSIA